MVAPHPSHKGRGEPQKVEIHPLCLKGMLSNTYRLISRILHLLLLLIAQRSTAFVGDTIEE